MYLDRVRNILNNIGRLKWSVAFKGIMAGALSGLLVVLYRFIIKYGEESSGQIYAYLYNNPIMIIVWAVVIAGAGLLLGWLVKMEPMASGSGIPQVEGVLLYGIRMRWYLVLAVRFIGGAVGSLFGLSLGREGPSIQIGAAAAKGFSRFTAKSKLEKHLIITGGAAAGLSAAFSAPLSGMVFALEEVHRSFSPYILLVATAASLTADIVSKIIFGLEPILYFLQIPQVPIQHYIWLVPAAVFFGLVGSLMNKMLLFSQKLYARIPWYLRISIALLIALPFGLFLPQVLGGGHNLVEIAESAENIIGFIALLIAGKLIFTSFSFGSGTPGGIFLPILSVGALAGCLFAIAVKGLGLPAEYVPALAVCGMAGTLAASVKAPVTSILLIAELTGSLMHLLPVALCVFLALFVSDLLKVKPIYEALLERYMSNDPQPSEDGKRNLFEMPVEAGSGIANKTLKNVSLPQGCLVIGIRRGTKEIVPQGDTKVMPGDYLMILCNPEDTDEVRERVQNLTRLE